MSEEAGFLTRAFTAGAATFVVRCPSAQMRDAVEDLLTDLPDRRGPSVMSVISISRHDNDRVSVQVDGGEPGPPQEPMNALARLVTVVTRLSLDAEPERLHLHCAGVDFNGKGVLISAASGTGKTSLAAALASRGWRYLSDESVALENDGSSAIGFPKPLMIKSGSRALLPGLEGSRVTLGSGDDAYWHVPATAMSATTVDELTPSLVVILYRLADGSKDRPPEPIKMERADAVVALMGQTMDAGRFGPDAVSVLARLTARCMCVTLPVGPLEASAEALEELVQNTPRRVEVHELEQTSGPAPGGWRVVETVRSIVVEDRVVVHDTSGGTIAALDEVGSAVWKALCGQSPSWWSTDSFRTPGITGFLHQLAAEGLVVQTETE